MLNPDKRWLVIDRYGNEIYMTIGPRSFPLTGLDDLRQTVVEIITTPPVSHFLKVLSFYPSPALSAFTPISYVNLTLALPA